ncbi:hypothetical protein [uncultured Fibrella sp.]|uniref:hypothetical protein n=1 Tax=uncultured Fibrella sp. TaxID=1284596 RepID=UPI0035CA3FE1
MKNVFYLLFVVTIAACGKKGDDVTPDAASAVAGTYEVSSLKQTSAGGTSITYTLPTSATSGSVVTTLSGQLATTRQTATTIGVVFLIKATGQADAPNDLGTFEVKGSDLYNANTKVGTADGTALNLDVTDSKGTRSIIISKKK